MKIPQKYKYISQSGDKMNIDEKSYEWVAYNAAGFPVYMRKGMLSAYPNYTAESHWHDDLEFTIVQSGEMQYNVNGEICTLREGDGVFVNSRQFHYGFSENRRECEFVCFLFHPVLLCASQYIEHNYVTPILQNAALPYLVLDKTAVGQNTIVRLLSEIYDSTRTSTDAFCENALNTVARFYDIWFEICKLGKNAPKAKREKNSKLSILKNMISFIQNNYGKDIRIADIAKAGAVGKTECCAIFKQYTNSTPCKYLTDYRLRKSAELLVSTDMTATEICFETGFSDSSYFTKIFGETFSCTPKQYRKANKLI